MCQGKYVIFGGDVRDPRYFHSGSPNSTSKSQEFSLSSRYFNVVLKERWGGAAGGGRPPFPLTPPPDSWVLQTLVKLQVVEAKSLLLIFVEFMRGVNI